MQVGQHETSMVGEGVTRRDISASRMDTISARKFDLKHTC